MISLRFFTINTGILPLVNHLYDESANLFILHFISLQYGSKTNFTLTNLVGSCSFSPPKTCHIEVVMQMDW